MEQMAQIEQMVTVTSPGGRKFLYETPVSEARYLVRSGQAKRISEKQIELRDFNLPEWMKGTRYHEREALPDREHTTCYCWNLKPLSADLRSLFMLSVTDCFVGKARI